MCRVGTKTHCGGMAKTSCGSLTDDNSSQATGNRVKTTQTLSTAYAAMSPQFRRRRRAVIIACAFGSAAAFFNMRWLAQVLLRPEGAATGLLVLRFGLIGGAAYVILETFGISPLFVLAGLLSASLAVVLEILFQLFYALV